MYPERIAIFKKLLLKKMRQLKQILGKKEITNCQLRITNWELSITNYELSITNYELSKPAVDHHQTTVGHFGEFFVVGNNDNGLTKFFLQFKKEFV